MSEFDAPHQSPSTPDLASPALSNAIERLMANPDLLASVASAIGLSPPHSLGTQSEASPTKSEGKSDVLPTASTPSGTGDLGHAVAALAPLLTGFSGKGGGKSAPDDPRACLLRALKPYVNPRRAEAIDTIIGLSRVSEMIKTLNEKGG